MAQTVKQDLSAVVEDLKYAVAEKDWDLVNEEVRYLNTYAESIPPYLVMIPANEYQKFVDWQKEQKLKETH